MGMALALALETLPLAHVSPTSQAQPGTRSSARPALRERRTQYSLQPAQDKHALRSLIRLSPKPSSEKKMGGAFWSSSPSSFNVGLDSPQLAAAKSSSPPLPPIGNNGKRLYCGLQAFSPIFSSLPSRGSKHEQQAQTDVASLANHPPDSRFPPPINAQSMGGAKSELAQMFPPTAADSESCWQTNRVMNASARSAPTPHPPPPSQLLSHPSLGKAAAGSPHQERLLQSRRERKRERR